MTIIDEIENAIQVHCAWADRLRVAINTGSCDLTPKTAGRDNVCAFGKWLYSAAIPDDAKSLPGYQNAITSHANFHKNAAKVLELALTGKKPEALQHMDTTSEYEISSVTLTLILRGWQVDIQSTLGTPG